MTPFRSESSESGDPFHLPDRVIVWAVQRFDDKVQSLPKSYQGQALVASKTLDRKHSRFSSLTMGTQSEARVTVNSSQLDSKKVAR